MERLLSVDAMGGFYGHVVDKTRLKDSIKGYIQYCSSEKCCAKYITRKWTNKKTGEVQEKKYFSHFIDHIEIKKTTKRSELVDDCPKCGHALLTYTVKYPAKEGGF